MTALKGRTYDRTAPAWHIVSTALAIGEPWVRFCRGMWDDLITELSRYPDLVVMARGGSLADPYAAAELPLTNADYQLRGSMQASKHMLHSKSGARLNPPARSTEKERPCRIGA